MRRSARGGDGGALGRRARVTPAAAALALAAALATAATTAAAAPARNDDVLVKVAPGATRAQVARIGAALDAEAQTPLPAGWRRYRLPEPVTLAEARDDLSTVAADRAVVLDGTLRATADPNDTFFDYQWSLKNTGDNQGYGGTVGADIGAVSGWAQMGTLAPVVVAVVDEGVDFTNPDLAGVAWDNPDAPGTHGWDYVANDATPLGEPHGTHVAGTIAAATGNGTGVAGVAPNARIMSVRFLDDSAGGTGNYSNAILAMDWARDHGAAVINASWGGGYSQPVCDAIADVVASGVTVVAAAGNSALDLETSPGTPGSCTSSGLVVVGASDQDDQLASFSNRGATSVDLAAPGVNIASTMPGTSWSLMSGTSMAGPHVAGVVAIAKGAHAGLTPVQLRSAVMAGGTAVAALSGSSVTGRRLSLPGTLAVLAPPATPGLTAPAAGASATAGDVAFSWSAAAGVDYTLVVDGTGHHAGVGTGTATVTLAAGTHTWSVRAASAYGITSASGDRTLTLAAAGSDPPSPAPDPPPAPDPAPAPTPAPADTAPVPAPVDQPVAGPPVVAPGPAPVVKRLATVGKLRAGRPIRLTIQAARAGTVTVRMRSRTGRTVLSMRVTLTPGTLRLTLFPSASVTRGPYRITVGSRAITVRVR